MKILVISLLITAFSISAFGQTNIQVSKNTLHVGFNRSYLTTGDRSGFHFFNEYQRKVGNRAGYGTAFGILYSAKESSIMLEVEDYENNLLTGDWMFTVEDGTKILEMKTDQQIYIHLDLFFKYILIKYKRFNLDLLGGGSFAYISNSYLTRWELGTFTGLESGEQNLQLYYPYYSRLFDLGITSRITINYQLFKCFSIGIAGGINHYFQSAYRFYDYGITLGVSF